MRGLFSISTHPAFVVFYPHGLDDVGDHLLLPRVGIGCLHSKPNPFSLNPDRAAASISTLG